jgi:hypothetical protein
MEFPPILNGRQLRQKRSKNSQKLAKWLMRLGRAFFYHSYVLRAHTLLFFTWMILKIYVYICEMW